MSERRLFEQAEVEQNIKKQFEKISKRIIVESEIGVIQGILEMIKIVDILHEKIHIEIIKHELFF